MVPIHLASFAAATNALTVHCFSFWALFSIAVARSRSVFPWSIMSSVSSNEKPKFSARFVQRSLLPKHLATLLTCSSLITSLHVWTFSRVSFVCENRKAEKTILRWPVKLTWKLKPKNFSNEHKIMYHSDCTLEKLDRRYLKKEQRPAQR